MRGTSFPAKQTPKVVAPRRRDVPFLRGPESGAIPWATAATCMALDPDVRWLHGGREDRQLLLARECRWAGAEGCVHRPGARSVIVPDAGFPMTQIQDMVPPRR